MGLSDALIVTALGMGVVFTGLLLTAGLIVVFGLLARPRREPRAAAAAVPAAPVTAAGPAELPADVVAVIATVLEVERRLYRAEAGGVLRGGTSS